MPAGKEQERVTEGVSGDPRVARPATHVAGPRPCGRGAATDGSAHQCSRLESLRTPDLGTMLIGEADLLVALTGLKVKVSVRFSTNLPSPLKMHPNTIFARSTFCTWLVLARTPNLKLPWA